MVLLRIVLFVIYFYCYFFYFFTKLELTLLYVCFCQLSVLQKQAVPKVSFLPWCARYACISTNMVITNISYIFIFKYIF